jgi:hypothetical protein
MCPAQTCYGGCSGDQEEANSLLLSWPLPVTDNFLFTTTNRQDIIFNIPGYC